MLARNHRAARGPRQISWTSTVSFQMLILNSTSQQLIYINIYCYIFIVIWIYTVLCITQVASIYNSRSRFPQSLYAPSLYRVYKKKLNRFEIALNFAKQLFVSGFFIYIASLGTYNVEKWEKFLELKFCEPGRCVFSNKLKMARTQNLKAAIIFWVNRWKICRIFNYCTKFQTIWFSLGPLTIHAKLHFS
jgi:hypothetical protein